MKLFFLEDFRYEKIIPLPNRLMVIHESGIENSFKSKIATRTQILRVLKLQFVDIEGYSELAMRDFE